MKILRGNAHILISIFEVNSIRNTLVKQFNRPKAFYPVNKIKGGEAISRLRSLLWWERVGWASRNIGTDLDWIGKTIASSNETHEGMMKTFFFPFKNIFSQKNSHPRLVKLVKREKTSIPQPPQGWPKQLATIPQPSYCTVETSCSCVALEVNILGLRPHSSILSVAELVLLCWPTRVAKCYSAGPSRASFNSNKVFQSSNFDCGSLRGYLTWYFTSTSPKGDWVKKSAKSAHKQKSMVFDPFRIVKPQVFSDTSSK